MASAPPLISWFLLLCDLCGGWEWLWNTVTEPTERSRVDLFWLRRQPPSRSVTVWLVVFLSLSVSLQLLLMTQTLNHSSTYFLQLWCFLKPASPVQVCTPLATPDLVLFTPDVIPHWAPATSCWRRSKNSGFTEGRAWQLGNPRVAILLL